jgi:hypothetical protein
MLAGTGARYQTRSAKQKKQNKGISVHQKNSLVCSPKANCMHEERDGGKDGIGLSRCTRRVCEEEEEEEGKEEEGEEEEDEEEGGEEE